jgi:hypothetical protein
MLPKTGICLDKCRMQVHVLITKTSEQDQNDSFFENAVIFYVGFWRGFPHLVELSPHTYTKSRV